jgi:hypothetical protein
MEKSMTDQFEQLDQLRRSLSLPPEQMAIEDVVPVFVPASLAEEGKWLGPIITMQAPGLAVTWACLQPAQTMRYVNFETAEYWEAQGVEWQMQSMENLVRMTEELSSHTFLRADGSYYGLAMMHEDGIGPSRLLLNGWLEEVFPEGYLVSIPERSVGVVLSLQASAEEREKVEGLVKDCFEKGSQPFIAGLFEPSLLSMA